MDKIDVLAVLDSVIERSGHVVASDVVQARAAVAELIEALRSAKGAMDECFDTYGHDDDWIYDSMGSTQATAYFRLRAALANVQPARTQGEPTS